MVFFCLFWYPRDSFERDVVFLELSFPSSSVLFFCSFLSFLFALRGCVLRILCARSFETTFPSFVLRLVWDSLSGLYKTFFLWPQHRSSSCGRRAKISLWPQRDACCGHEMEPRSPQRDFLVCGRSRISCCGQGERNLAVATGLLSGHRQKISLWPQRDACRGHREESRCPQKAFFWWPEPRSL